MLHHSPLDNLSQQLTQVSPCAHRRRSSRHRHQYVGCLVSKYACLEDFTFFIWAGRVNTCLCRCLRFPEQFHAPEMLLLLVSVRDGQMRVGERSANPQTSRTGYARILHTSRSSRTERLCHAFCSSPCVIQMGNDKLFCCIIEKETVFHGNIVSYWHSCELPPLRHPC